MRRGIYVASKTAHAAWWRNLRAGSYGARYAIVSTWIDEAGAGESGDLADLARRCIEEAVGAAALVLYCAPGEVLRGGWVEVGAALASGVPVFSIGPVPRSVFCRHALWTECESMERAMELAQACCAQAAESEGGAVERRVERATAQRCARVAAGYRAVSGEVDGEVIGRMIEDLFDLPVPGMKEAA